MRSAGTTGFRSFQDTNSSECRIRCTMQVWMIVSGKTALIASGNPFRPSTTAMRMSPTPRFLSSFMTRSQNLAPFGVLDPQAENVLGAVRLDAEGDVDCLVADHALVSDLDPHCVEEDERVTRLQWTVLPFRHGLQNRVRHRRDQIGGDLEPIELHEVALNLPRGHAARIHRHDLLVEAGEAALIPGDQLRIERPFPIAGNPDVELRGLRQNGLLRMPRWFRRPSGASLSRWSSSSALRTRSASAFFSSSKSPSLLKTSFGSRPSRSWSSVSFLIAISALHRRHYGPAHKIPDSPRPRM